MSSSSPATVHPDSTSPEAAEDDPIVTSYSVFIKPPLPVNRQLLVLQHPNTQNDNPDKLFVPPVTTMRLKPESGMLEADVPLDYSSNYDRHKGMVWGSAAQKSAAAKTSLGLAGGFGVGGAPARGRGGRGRGEDDNVEGGDWGEAVRNDRILRTQTLGGLATETSEARYMVAVFQGKNIHLTPVTSLAHLRPQLHHIDATAEQDRISRASNSASSAAGAQQKDAPAARAIHMTIKSMGDGSDEAVTLSMADRLRHVQLEHWKKVDFAHEESKDAWVTYQQSLLLQTFDGVEEEGKPVPMTDDKGKEPAVEGQQGQEDVGNAGAPDLSDRVHGLGTEWEEDQLLRAVSGIKATDKKPGEEAVTDHVDLGARVKKGPVKKEVVKPDPEAEGKKKGGRKPAVPRGGRTKGTAMEID
ncbi:Sin-like protein conserved region-domain-containing protein [Coniochaeta sp. 2T2.1]|nr:Sin-like protein conserved region-domain-containing protein [Coniochaeta sp. 2T2.1]